jgi:hypothetical protein
LCPGWAARWVGVQSHVVTGGAARPTLGVPIRTAPQ